MSASRRSSETPCQWVSNLDHLVTQCRSTVGRSEASPIRSVQDQVCSAPVSVVTVNCQESRLTRGVGPADSTGKSWASYCPGGSRPSDDLGRPRKPGEKVATVPRP